MMKKTLHSKHNRFILLYIFILFSLLKFAEAHPWGTLPAKIFEEIGVAEPLHVLDDGNHVPPYNTAWAKAFSPDGSMIVTGNCDREAILWDVQTGERLRTFKHPNPLDEGICPQIDFSPDGAKIAFGNIWGSHSDAEIVIWDINTGEQLQSIRDGGKFEFSPDGKLLLTSPVKKTRIWNIDTGEIIFEQEATAAFGDATFHPDNTKVLVDGNPDDGITTKLYEINSGEIIQEYDSGAGTDLGSIEFTPDGSKWVGTGSQNEDMIVFDTASGMILNIIRSAENGGHHNIDISPDGTKILTNRSILYDLYTGEPLRAFGRGDYSWAWGEVKYSPSGNHVATGEDALQIWDVSDLNSSKPLDPTQSSIEFFMNYR